jgi:hypothetical protein
VKTTLTIVLLLLAGANGCESASHTTQSTTTTPQNVERPKKAEPPKFAEFEVPWNTSFKQKGPGKSSLVQFQFDSGQNVTFIVPANQGGLLTEMVQDDSLKMRDLQLIFGDLMDRSAYDQYGALLNTTPRSIRAFGPRAEAVRGITT